LESRYIVEPKTQIESVNIQIQNNQRIPTLKVAKKLSKCEKLVLGDNVYYMGIIE